jgi:hypothetical protein
VFWIRNTIKNVTIELPVLITSCQVSENRKYGPTQNQTITIASVEMKAQGEPALSATLRASFRNTSADALFAPIFPLIRNEATHPHPSAANWLPHSEEESALTI